MKKLICIFIVFIILIIALISATYFIAMDSGRVDKLIDINNLISNESKTTTVVEKDKGSIFSIWLKGVLLFVGCFIFAALLQRFIEPNKNEEDQ